MFLLRRYNAEIVKLDENGVSHKARTYFLGPLVIIVIGFLIGISIWTLLPTVLESEAVLPILFLIGLASLPVSSAIE